MREFGWETERVSFVKVYIHVIVSNSILIYVGGAQLKEVSSLLSFRMECTSNVDCNNRVLYWMVTVESQIPTNYFFHSLYAGNIFRKCFSIILGWYLIE